MMHGLNLKPPQIALVAVVFAWLAVVAPGLSKQYSKLIRAHRLLAERSATERAALLDNPAFSVAEEIRRAAPPGACVLVLAYAGPAAIEYYRARLGYLLYPRRVQVEADSAAEAADCPYLAVFRDSEPNLAAEPFGGSWDGEQLQRRLSSLERLAASKPVEIFRLR